MLIAKQCKKGEVCRDGECACPAGWEKCGHKCKDVKKDEDNCGKCGNKVRASPLLCSRACEFMLMAKQCKKGDVCQNGACIDPAKCDNSFICDFASLCDETCNGFCQPGELRPCPHPTPLRNDI